MNLNLGTNVIALALRRGELRDYSTLDELLDGDLHVIQWKEEALDKPVFRTAGPKGRGITEKPMRDDSHRDYLHKTGKSSGIEGAELIVAPYGMRHNFATTLSRSLDSDTVRSAMGHNPDSTVLESVYNHVLPTIDFMAHMLGEEVASKEDMMAADQPVLWRHTKVADKLSIEAFLEREPYAVILMEQARMLREFIAGGRAGFIAEDEGWKECILDKSMLSQLRSDDNAAWVLVWTQNRIKKLKKSSEEKHNRELNADAHKKVASTMTTQELLRRKDEADEGSRIMTIMQQAKSKWERGDLQPVEMDRNNEDDDQKVEDIPVIETNGVDDEETPANAIEEDYIKLLRHLVEAVDTPAKSEGEVLCEECSNDFTTSHDDVVHDWKSQYHLKRHLQQFHNPTRRVVRMLVNKGCQKDTGGERLKWCCDICAKVVKIPSELIKHIHAAHEDVYAPDEFELVNASMEESKGNLRGSDSHNTKQEATSRNLKGKWKCPDCQEDVSCGTEQRDHLWSVGGLKDHRKSQFHQPAKQCIRILTSLEEKLPGSALRLHCPWCTDSRTYKQWVDVIKHAIDDMHDEPIPEEYLQLFHKRVGSSEYAPLPADAITASTSATFDTPAATSLFTSFIFNEFPSVDEEDFDDAEMLEDLERFGQSVSDDLDSFGDVEMK